MFLIMDAEIADVALEVTSPGLGDGDGFARRGSSRGAGTTIAERLLLQGLALAHCGGPPVPGLPTGTVTFLFTDIEGSTTLLQRLGDRRYGEILAEHQRLLRDAFAKGNGRG